MPKRVVDGDAVWRSKKLKQMSPQFRAEYANLVPLAEANGVFEVDVDRVWSDVYSYNREGVSVETVQEILSELETVGLLRVWEQDGKTWGYWEGIHKSGRLPKASELQKYKNLPPNPPEISSLSGVSAESARILAPRFGIGLVLDRSGIGAEPQDETEIISEETDMRAEKEIQLACQAAFGVSPRLWGNDKEEIKRLERIHKGSSVLRAFEEWAEQNQEDPSDNPVRKFLREADSLLRGETNVQKAATSPEILTLTASLTRLSDRKVVFSDQSRARLATVLQAYTADEITESFKSFMETQDFSIPRVQQYAAKNFAEAANDLAYNVRQDRIDKAKADVQREAAKLRLQEEAEAERAKAEFEKQKEEDLFDPLA